MDKLPVTEANISINILQGTINSNLFKALAPESYLTKNKLISNNDYFKNNFDVSDQWVETHFLKLFT
jgi:hypothetical protein